jgi:hypothetical protein
MAQHQAKSAAVPLTAEEIRRIAGRLSDDRVSAILATGATAADVVEAFTRLSNDEHLERPLTGVVAAVYDILKPDEPDEEDLAR